MKKVLLLLGTFIIVLSCEKEPYLSINPTVVNCDAKSGSSSISLSCNMTWTVSGIPDWITLKPANGEGDATVIVEYDANTQETDRSSTLTFNAGVATVSLVVSQKGVDPTTYSISNQTGFIMYSVVIFEFDNAGDITKDVSIGTMNNLQTTSKIKASKNCNKIKVGLKIAENLDYLYTASYTYLEKEQNTNLTLIWSTIFDNSENIMFLAKGNPRETEYEEDKVFSG
ncbi:MAG: BACON domain-containing protein [Anaerolineaceae bacterium]|nr:BACON domain-containing protein [Anaerolineaceae bacterium]